MAILVTLQNMQMENILVLCTEPFLFYLPHILFDTTQKTGSITLADIHISVVAQQKTNGA